MQETDQDVQKLIQDMADYEDQRNGREQFVIEEENLFPCMTDYRCQAGEIDSHYFFQDIYMANRLLKDGCHEVYDIGSRVDGFISHILSMGIQVTMIDIRPLEGQIDGLHFIQANAVDLDGIADGSISALSSLHAIEHFGLGRYGDPVDYDGWKKALHSFGRVLKDRGKLYLSVPCGTEEKVMFNAHRIFSPLTIIREVPSDMVILEFALLHDGRIQVFDFSDMQPDEVREKVLAIRKTLMGDCDCGMFVFQRQISAS